MPPIHPCGLAVDRKRYCVREHMRFWRDSEQLVEVQWFWVPEGTPYVPHMGQFRGREFAKPDEVQWYNARVFKGEMGERYYDTRTRVRGDRPALAPPTHGARPCGRPDQWLDGSVVDIDPPLVAGLGGWPLCCDAVPLPPPPPPPPPGCVQPMRINVSGFSEADAGALNGSFVLCKVTDDFWSSDVVHASYCGSLGGSYSWELSRSGGGPLFNWALAPTGFSFDRPTYAVIGTNWDQTVPIALPAFFGGCPADHPTVIVVSPFDFSYVLATENAVAIATESGKVLTTEGGGLPPLP